MRSTVHWDYNGLRWSESFGAAGALVTETFDKISDHKTVGKGVNFTNQTWANYSFPGTAVQVSLSQVGVSMRSEIAAKHVHVIAYPLLHGIQTIEFSIPRLGNRATPTSATTKEWINRVTYLPLQIIGNDGVDNYVGTFTDLAPTAKNLQQFVPRVPPNFKDCMALPSNALALAKCLIEY